MYPVDLENNEKSCEHSAIQYVAKSIATWHVKKNSPYNQPKQYFFKKLLWSHFWKDFNQFYTKTFRIVRKLPYDRDDMCITATMNKLRHRVYKCNDVLFTFFTPIDLWTIMAAVTWYWSFLLWTSTTSAGIP
jgi:hypothetical protein